MALKKKVKKAGNYRGGRKPQRKIPSELKPYLQRLKFYRDRVHQNQKGMAANGGISRAHLAKIESGTAVPKLDDLFLMLLGAKTTLEEYFQSVPFAASAETALLHIKLEELIRAHPKIGPHVIREIELNYDAAIEAAKKEADRQKKISTSSQKDS
jgi:transcriptional regulator with XRE-family HTH domain